MSFPGCFQSTGRIAEGICYICFTCVIRWNCNSLRMLARVYASLELLYITYFSGWLVLPHFPYSKHGNNESITIAVSTLNIPEHCFGRVSQIGFGPKQVTGQ